MMTQELGFSILTAPLAAMDRRALSQAWYSALHVVRDRDPERQVAGRKQREPAAVLRPPLAPARTRDARSGRAATCRVARAEDPSRGAFPSERRGARSALGIKIERVLAERKAPARRVSFTVDGSAARVHVALARSEAGVQLVALCPPALRARLARALEEARYALAARGIPLRCTLPES